MSTHYFWMSCAALQKLEENKIISAGLAMIKVADMAHSTILRNNICDDHNLGMFMTQHVVHCRDQYCPISLAFAELNKYIQNKEALKGITLRSKIADRIKQAGDRFLKDGIQANEKNMMLKLLYINFLIEYLENYTYVWFLIEKIKKFGNFLEKSTAHQYK